jgi:hypothetical protein
MYDGGIGSGSANTGASTISMITICSSNVSEREGAGIGSGNGVSGNRIGSECDRHYSGKAIVSLLTIVISDINASAQRSEFDDCQEQKCRE